VSVRTDFATFKAGAEAANAEIHRCAGVSEALELVAELLRSAGVCDAPGCYALWAPCELCGERERAALGRRVPGLRFDVDRGTAELARVGVSQMDYAIADTGTLVQDATAPEQRLVSTLPDIHIALCRTSALVADLPTLLARGLVTSEPSYYAMITGPSRTADIERVLTIGAHGPRRLLVVFVDDAEQT
jgi:L-lactate dehydrogenase complex protein LldG